MGSPECPGKTPCVQADLRKYADSDDPVTEHTFTCAQHR
jgi:hypothetical protein